MVREESLTLYGFADEDERQVFETVQTVSGLGPRLALAMLAVHSPDAVRGAITTGDHVALTKVPGIGRKGAERIVLELRDKIGVPSASVGRRPSGSAAWQGQVREALVGLGWTADRPTTPWRRSPRGRRRRHRVGAAQGGAAGARPMSPPTRDWDDRARPRTTARSRRRPASSTPEPDERDRQVEAALRPRRLADFPGQTRVREQLSLVLEAAQRRGTPPDHVLLSGPPGLGKTTLAMIVATELEQPIRVTSGPAIQHAGDLASILSSLAEGEVLFLDEIHRMSRPAEEMLYLAMEDFRVDVVVGKGPGATAIPLELPPFTVVGATTRAGLLPGAVARPVRVHRPPRLLLDRRARP